MIKFTAIATGQWCISPNMVNHTLYGLGEDGQIYKHSNSKGWSVLSEQGINSPVSLPKSVKDREW